MKLRFNKPTIPYDLTQSGKVDAYQQYLAGIAGTAWVGFSMDFGNNVLEIDTDSDNAALFAEFGEYIAIIS